MLEIDNLVYRYGDWSLICDLRVQRGELLAVIGPSGAGKSTLLALIAGFEKPRSGSIRIDGQDVTRLPPWQRPVTTLFQENNLFSHLSVEQNVALGRHPGLRLTAHDRAAVQQALDAVGLARHGARLPAELSGGERQRAALARCLCQRRPVLLLDEPFASLDPALRGEMRALVERLRLAHGLTVIMVSHHPQELSGQPYQGVFLYQGRVMAKGLLAQLLENPPLPQLREYLGFSVASGPGNT